jgi:hypothetical protein
MYQAFTFANSFDQQFRLYRKDNQGLAQAVTSIFCHAGWKGDPGFALVPDRSMVCFYTAKGVGFDTLLATEYALQQHEPAAVETALAGQSVLNYSLGAHQDNQAVLATWVLSLQNGAAETPDLILVRGEVREGLPPDRYLALSDMFRMLRSHGYSYRYRFCACRDSIALLP